MRNQEAGCRLENAVCPYDYFSESLKHEYYDLFAAVYGTLLPGADCRGASQDVGGTISGHVF